jgi:membrane peptidoglycan carboxypeptidase
VAAKDRPNPFGTVAKLVVVVVVCGVLAAGFLLPYVGGIGLAARNEAAKFLDTQCNLTETPPPVPTQIYASDNRTLIATVFNQDRQPIPLSSVPMILQKALVATEDRRFYSHHGVDMRGLIRSAISTSNGDTQGGSTLTMQYVKQIRYYQAGDNIKAQKAAISQNLNRKIEDAKCALYIENTEHESKATILDNYLNIAFFGENSYGLQTAAETYFDKPASQLTLPESAMLVGLLRAPSAYDPFQHPTQALDRRNEVLQNLVDVGDLTEKQAKKYAATPVALATQRPPLIHEGCANADSTILNVGFFCDYVTNWLTHNAGISDSQLETGGLRIVTTLNAKLQNSMETNLAKALPATSPMTAILPVVDPHTGNILAMATSKRYGNHRGNSAFTTLPIFTSYTAQGASTYKLFPLLTALSTGVPTNWKLETPQNGQPYKAACLTPSNTTNGDAQEHYKKNETLASATAKSSNTFFVGMADQLFGCDLQPIVDMAEKLGMKGLLQPSDTPKLSIAQAVVNFQRAQQLVLGDIATSPLEIAGAYAAVANAGRYNTPSPILSITKPVVQTTTAGAPTVTGSVSVPVKRPKSVQVVSPQVALTAVKVLTGDTSYPGTSSKPFAKWYASAGSIVAGKTGTSVAVSPTGKDTNKNASLWFVGVTPNLVSANVLVNLNSPNTVASGLPGIKNAGLNAYGAYAAKVWLAVLSPSLLRQHWLWQDPDTVAGQAVPDITGKTLAVARGMLAQAGYSMVQLDQANTLECASSKPVGYVAFYGPKIAPKGSTITWCPSSGGLQLIYHKPIPIPSSSSNTPSGSGSGSGSSGSGSGSGGPSSPGGSSSGSGSGSGSGSSSSHQNPGPPGGGHHHHPPH